MSGNPLPEEVLPHRSPMILLDRIEEVSEETITCSLSLRSDSPFVESGSVPAVVATEYMAQCVAAFAGVKARRDGDPIQVGFLIGARTIEFEVDHFSVDEELVVHARRIWGDDNLGKFRCSVTSGGRCVVHGDLTVFRAGGDLIDNGRVTEGL